MPGRSNVLVFQIRQSGNAAATHASGKSQAVQLRCSAAHTIFMPFCESASHAIAPPHNACSDSPRMVSAAQIGAASSIRICLTAYNSSAVANRSTAAMTAQASGRRNNRRCSNHSVTIQAGSIRIMISWPRPPIRSRIPVRTSRAIPPPACASQMIAPSPIISFRREEIGSIDHIIAKIPGEKTTSAIPLRFCPSSRRAKPRKTNITRRNCIPITRSSGENWKASETSNTISPKTPRRIGPDASEISQSPCSQTWPPSRQLSKRNRRLIARPAIKIASALIIQGLWRSVGISGSGSSRYC